MPVGSVILLKCPPAIVATMNKRPLRVAMVTDVYFPRINGVSTSIETFRRDLPTTGVQVSLIAPKYPANDTCADAPDIVRVPSRKIPFDPEDRLMHWNALTAATRWTSFDDIDLIHIQTPFAAHYAGVRLARRLRKPVVATYHTHFEEYIQHYLPILPRPWLRAAARSLARHQCNGLDTVIVPSPAMRDTLTEYGVTAPLTVLPTGIPVDQFRSGDGQRFRHRHDIPPHRPVALFVGRVAHEKNIELLIESLPQALAAQPELLLVIAGEGPALPALQRLAQQRGLTPHVRFVGYLDRSTDLPDCYAAADVFVFASKTETQGLVLLEAMAAGVPVFAISHLGTTSILDAHLGAVVAPDTPAAFGQGLAELLADPIRRQRLSEEAVAFARCWSAPERAQQLADLYRTLL